MSSEKEAAAMEIVKRLTKSGYQALYAGGFVRDTLLGLSEKGDIDIATNATPETIADIFPHVIGVGEHFGVMIVVNNNVPFEVATFRSDIGILDGRHPKRVEFTNAEHDAMRRDFTINGMFFDPLSGKLLDYVHGQEDLKNKIIRSMETPAFVLKRTIYAAFAASDSRPGSIFRLTGRPGKSLRKMPKVLTMFPPSAYFKSLTRYFSAARPDRALRLLEESGLLRIVLPEISETVGMEQPPEFHPEGDVFTHTVKALSFLDRPTRTTAWSVLLHDIGKPPTLSITDRIRFSNHQHVGARMAENVFARLKAPNNLTQDVCGCIENHMNFMNVTKMRLSTLKKFLSRPTFQDEMELHRVDCLASHGDISNYEFLRRKEREIPKDEVRPEPLLTGKNLIQLGLKPGPIFKKILGEAYDAQLEGKFSSPREAIDWARETHVP